MDKQLLREKRDAITRQLDAWRIESATLQAEIVRRKPKDTVRYGEYQRSQEELAPLKSQLAALSRNIAVAKVRLREANEAMGGVRNPPDEGRARRRAFYQAKEEALLRHVAPDELDELRDEWREEWNAVEAGGAI